MAFLVEQLPVGMSEDTLFPDSRPFFFKTHIKRVFINKCNRHRAICRNEETITGSKPAISRLLAQNRLPLQRSRLSKQQTPVFRLSRIQALKPVR
jgi:hypothetical protein